MAGEIKYKLTKHSIDSLLILANKIDELDEIALSEFKIRVEGIDKLWEAYVKQYISIEASKKAGFDGETHLAEYTHYETLIYKIKTIGNKLFAEHNASFSESDAKENKVVKPKFSIPKIKLPSFSGEITGFQSFKNVFDSLVHEDVSIPSIQKLHYLISCLSGEAYQLIRHLTISNENYHIAIEILNQRYYNPRVIAEKHLDLILNLPNISSGRITLREFINIVLENILALQALKFKVEEWSLILLHILLKKLTTELRNRFELKFSNSEIPMFTQFMEFLEIECRAEETCVPISVKKTDVNSKDLRDNHETKRMNTLFGGLRQKCACCEEDNHYITTCRKFLEMSINQRRQIVKQGRLCWNCLRNHQVKECRSNNLCRVCKRNHHTLLHFAEAQKDPTPSTSTSTKVEIHENGGTSTSVLHSTHEISDVSDTIVLGTAVIHVKDVFGRSQTVRALIDQGSQCCFMTEKCMTRLGLRKRFSRKTVYGVGNENVNNVKGEVTCIISPTFSDTPQIPVSSLVIKTITGNLPSKTITSNILREYSHLKLADAEFYKSRPVEMLLGADIYNEIIDGRIISFNRDLPSAHSTIFGWVVLGKIAGKCEENLALVSGCVTLDNLMQQFWDTETLPEETDGNTEDQECENHFLQTVSRVESGRFMVRLPFRKTVTELGNSYKTAVRRFYTLEGKLMRNSQLKTEYSNVIKEYLTLGHMEKTITSDVRYFLPHHCIIKDSSTTTRYRIVFDASMKSDSGVSLNSSIMTGRRLQNEVMNILIRFRLHLVVFIADIKQMYRQILLHPDDRAFHGVLWRDSPMDPLETYRLTTVTFGVASSPYQAMRCLLQLATEGTERFPNASRILQTDIFVDDIISGGSSVEEAILYRNELIRLLQGAGFELRKWISNKQQFLVDLPEEHCIQTKSLGPTNIKVLGIGWNPNSDSFTYTNVHISDTPLITKRFILSMVAGMYDPCGLLAPIIFTAKVIMQEIWLRKLDWDERVPDEIENKWRKYTLQFSLLSTINIPRLIISHTVQYYELHGFSDASKMGYAACVYLRSVDQSGKVNLHLLLGKTKVAPLKQKLTIPKMELCGVTLLAKSLKHVYTLLGNLSDIRIFGWCDSQVVLSWLKTPPHRLKPFEGNRVSSILANLESADWRYVPTSMNPADCATRCILPENLIGHTLWWTPGWLLGPSEKWPTCKKNLSNYETEKILSSDVTTCTTRVESWTIFGKYSSLSKLVTIAALCKRFIYNSRNKTNKRFGHISLIEWNSALMSLISNVQRTDFHDELNLIKREKPHMSRFFRLNPFIDPEGMLRVGGRLQNASLDTSSKHPIIIPKNHELTQLIIRYYHIKYLHAGPALTLSLIRGRFWIVSGRDSVRREVHKCIQCFRTNPRCIEPIMGDLPAFRVRPGRAFVKTGIDCGGPFYIKSSNLRRAKITKAYLCVFVCMVTKAVHLEVISDLSTASFLAALDRFVARRGLCTDLYSDWGTNFVGAENHLRDILNHPSGWKEFQSVMRERNITFHRNPPTASHMGGIWEATVKSSKTHLKRVIGETVLTFEELTTLFARIEAILNSRPLCGTSENVDDLEYLTPGHFLIGEALVSVPEANWDHVPDNHLSRWELLQKFSQQLWKRWSLEYLHTLHQRSKWTRNQGDIKINDLVLIKDDNLPPLKWKLARVVELFPGKDGIIRVVNVRTSSGVVSRPTVKICPLPCNS